MKRPIILVAIIISIFLLSGLFLFVTTKSNPEDSQPQTNPSNKNLVNDQKPLTLNQTIEESPQFFSDNANNSGNNANSNTAAMENEESFKVPADWKEYYGEKLAFKISLPLNWNAVSHSALYPKPDDREEPTSYSIANRIISDPMVEFTNDDVNITIKKLRLLNRSDYEVIQEDSRIYDSTPLEELTVNDLNARLMLRNLKSGAGTESHISFVMYLEDQDGLFCINATYSDQKRFDELNRTTVETIMRSFKKV